MAAMETQVIDGGGGFVARGIHDALCRRWD
jgi:hypothetical protein